MSNGNGNGNGSVAEVLGKIPSGCCVMTAASAGQSTGILASWIQQASFKPLQLTVAVKNGRPILDLIEKSGRFVLNLVGASKQKELFKHFGRSFDLTEPAFEGLGSQACDSGVIVQDAMGYLECRVDSKIAAGDHVVYVAEVVGGRSMSAGEPYVHIRKTAANY